jgi:hypothetical protein
MSDIRDLYVVAAGSTAALLRDPAVAAAWHKPSALPEFSVHGLAGHLARQVLGAPAVFAAPPPGERPLTLIEHYARSEWVGADVDAEVNVRVRDTGEQVADVGAEPLAAQVAATVEQLPGLLAAEPAERVVALPWAGWSLTLDDYLVTRIMEIAVHSDDLALSVGVPTPELPDPVLDVALGLLCRLAVRRHGQPAVLRAFSRVERAPASINAI